MAELFANKRTVSISAATWPSRLSFMAMAGDDDAVQLPGWLPVLFDGGISNRNELRPVYAQLLVSFGRTHHVMPVT